MRFIRSRKFVIALIIIVAVLSTISLQSLGGFSRIEAASFDHRVGLFRLNQAIHQDVVVVLIDEESLQVMAGELGRWPWSRAAYSDLLEFFALADAQAFAFDILFTEQQEAGENNRSDKALVEATRQAGNAVHSMQLLHSTPNNNKQSLPENFERLHAIQSDNIEGPYYNDYLLPIEALYEASRDIGFLEINPDRDGVYRRIRLFNQFVDQQVYPSLASALVLPLLADSNSIIYNWDRAEVGDLKVPLDGEGNYLINPYGYVTTYSASQVFASMKQIRAGESDNLILDPKQFAGKLVLLGASAIGLVDVKATALESKQAGVFLHAYTVSNLLQQDFLHVQKFSGSVAIYLLLSGITVISVFLIPHLFIASLCTLITATLYMIFAYNIFAYNQVYPVTPAIFVIVFSLLLSYSYRVYQEKFSRLKIRKMLGQYVSPTVLTAVIDSQEDLHAEVGSNENLSILFSDIRGFTNISELLEASQVVDLLNIYFSEMTEIIFTHDGTLDKFIGDAIMAFWGAPIKSLDHARLSVETAINMRSGLQRVNRRLIERNYPPIEIGIGIHTGNVVLGNIGSDKKLDYTIIGDSVNLASRLEGLTKIYGCGVIISEDTFEAIQLSIPCFLVDRVRVKGKEKPINLYTPTELFHNENGISVTASVLQDKFQQAFLLYLDRDWQGASEIYSQFGNCLLSELFQKRCKKNQADQPGQQWDGVYTHTTK